MKSWLMFVLMTVLCWGAYVPTLHYGQQAFSKSAGALRAFLCVGIAYFLVAVLVPLGLILSGKEPLEFNGKAVTSSLIAGALGAVGALGIILALKAGARPIYVAPVVFAGAPVVNTLVSMVWHRPEKAPSPYFFLGLILAATGAMLVLRFKPS